MDVATAQARVAIVDDHEVVALDLNLRDATQPAENVVRLTAWGAGVLAVASGENP